MSIQLIRRFLALISAAALLMSACTPAGVPDSKNDTLTWSIWGSYQSQKDLLDLVRNSCPDIELALSSYAGANRTGYSWAQMRADDITDIFVTSQMLDKDLAKERLADLSDCDFINIFPNAVLDQVAIDGGVYLLPTSYSMYGIFYNKTLMEEHGWKIPSNFEELSALCKEIKAAGLIPGIIGTQLTGNPFSAVFNLAKTSWLTTPEGVRWEQDFLAGKATAAGMWEGTMAYVQRYIDIGMFHTDPEDRSSFTLIKEYLGGRKAVFCTATASVDYTKFEDSGDELGLMPYISEDGSKNVYMYNPSVYFGISKRLTEPGNEKKLENALRILSLIFSSKGQAVFVSENTPCVMSVRGSDTAKEDALIFDAQQALAEGRAFPMTYARWENVLSDMGQAYKDWFRGSGSITGAQCIARMDMLQQDYLNCSDQLYFCESTADFTLEETGTLVGKALGSAVNADAVMVPLGELHKDGAELKAGVNGKLYAERINSDIASTICPSFDGEYAVLTMTGAEAKALAKTGFDKEGDGDPFPYVLVTRGERELDDFTSYQVAFLMNGYTEEVGRTYSAKVHEGSLKSFLQTYLREQIYVSPNGNPWK